MSVSDYDGVAFIICFSFHFALIRDVPPFDISKSWLFDNSFDSTELFELIKSSPSKKGFSRIAEFAGIQNVSKSPRTPLESKESSLRENPLLSSQKSSEGIACI